MKKVILFFLTIILAVSVNAATGDLSGYYFISPDITGDGSDWTARNANYQFVWADDAHTTIELTKNIAVTSDQDFTIAMTGWGLTTTIIAGDVQEMSSYNTPYQCYFGGGRNGKLKGGMNISKIRVVLPTNTNNTIDLNGGKVYVSGTAGAGSITFTESKVSASGVATGWYLRGEFNMSNNEWLVSDSFQFYSTDCPGVYKLKTENFTINGKFKVASANWTDLNCGKAGTIELNKAYEMPKNAPDGADVTANTIAFVRAYFYNNGEDTPLLLLTDDPNYDYTVWPESSSANQSKIWLQVWNEPQAGVSDSQVAWDTSGGLYDPILYGVDNAASNTDENVANFVSKYYTTYTDDQGAVTKYLAFYKATADQIVAEGVTPGSNQMVQYKSGSNVYYIDFREYTGDENGIYLRVPLKADMSDTKGNQNYANVPMIVRSGVRFTLLNTNYSADNNERDQERYVKYGHTFRLNEMPREITKYSDGWGVWNGITDSNPNANVTNCNEYHHKMGDNRLLSEYNLWLKRIVIEVVGEGATDGSDRIYVRFEGRYDLAGATGSQANAVYSIEGMAANSNNIGMAPVIFTGTNISWNDRAFARFYACNDASFHGLESMSDVESGISKYSYLDFTESYKAVSEYSLLDNEGNAMELTYTDVATGEIVTDTKITIHYAYDATNKEFIYTNSDYVIAATGKTPLTKYTDTEADPDGRYANATRVMLKGHDEAYIVDKDFAGAPQKVKAVTTYYFSNAEPNNVPEYEIEGDVKYYDHLDTNPVLNAAKKIRGTGNYDGWYCSDLYIGGTSYATDPMSATSQKFPVSYITYQQYDETAGIDNAQYATSYANSPTDGGAWSEKRVHDRLLEYGSNTVENVWITDATKIDDGGEATINYITDIYYTFGRVQGLSTVAEIRNAGLFATKFPESELATVAEEESEEEHINLYHRKSSEITTTIAPDKTLTYYLEEVRSRATASVTFNGSESTTGINAVDATDVTISTNGLCLTIDGATEGTPIAVYSITGNTIYSGFNTELYLPQAGLYIVKVGGTVTKIAAN